ncbi:MAG: aminotransferase class I/II-fold pyridoxal phosphate-dependent enzyme [candidate division WOR-3 bacterium]
MKPYQVNLFVEQEKTPVFLPSEPVFVHNNKKYLNFSLIDCFNRRNDEYLNETARLNIDNRNVADVRNPNDYMEELKNTMAEFKKLDSIIVFSDEISATYALFSIFSSKTFFYIDYETSPIIYSVLQYRNVEFYNHQNLEQFSKLLSLRSEKVIVIEGLYEWIGCSGPINDLIKIAKENQAMIIVNELNSFGLLGRDGRGVVDLYNLYEDVNIEIGSFNRYIGGYGAYIGAKKYLINKINENTNGVYMPVPKFMLAVNLAGIEMLKNEAKNRQSFSKLWTNSRFFINRLKQIGLKTISETPVVVVILNNNQEAEAFSKRLFDDGIITSTNKERVRMVLSIEHSRADLDYTLDRIELHFKDMGIVYP